MALDGNGTMTGTNGTDQLTVVCAKLVPSAQTLFATMPAGGYVVFSILVLFTLITFGIYAEEIYYIVRNFKNEYRLKTTLWILAIYPVYSSCALLGAAVPRAGPLVDMVASVYFGTCIFNFSGLMMNYLGGRRNAMRVIADGRPVKMNVPPCCCCCLCLPTVKFRPVVMNRVTFMVLQIVVVRPVMMFSGAILFVNGNYDYGTLTPYPMYALISLVNAISMLLAIYGLMLFQRIFRSELEKRFLIVGKTISIQLILLISSLPNLIITMLVALRVLKCNSLLPAPTRGEEICQSVIVLSMMPLSIVGRVFFRRATDATLTEKDHRPTFNDIDQQQLLQVQQQQQQAINNMMNNLQEPYQTKSNKSAISIDTVEEGREPDNQTIDDDNIDDDHNGELENSDEVAHSGRHRNSVCDANGEGLDCSLWHQSSV